MDKYKINYIFSGEKNINDIFISVLNKEVKRFLMICKNEKCDELSPYTGLFFEESRHFK